MYIHIYVAAAVSSGDVRRLYVGVHTYIYIHTLCAEKERCWTVQLLYKMCVELTLENVFSAGELFFLCAQKTRCGTAQLH